jgi:hypothetical protein
MERPQAVPNFWLVVQTAVWFAVLGYAFDYISDRNRDVVIRRVFRYFLGRDPVEPPINADGLANILA